MNNYFIYKAKKWKSTAIGNPKSLAGKRGKSTVVLSARTNRVVHNGGRQHGGRKPLLRTRVLFRLRNGCVTKGWMSRKARYKSISVSRCQKKDGKDEAHRGGNRFAGFFHSIPGRRKALFWSGKGRSGQTRRSKMPLPSAQGSSG